MIRLSRAVTSAALAAVVGFTVSVHAPAARADAASTVEEALAGDDEDAILDAISEAAKSTDATAVAAVGKALDSKSAVTVEAALDALGRMRCPEAVEALHSAYRNKSRIRDNDVMFAKLLKAIGRQADPSSVEILADSPFDKLTVESGRARIMGLGRIRTRASLDALRAMAVKAGPSVRGVDSSEFMGKFAQALRCSACVLSGEDFGTSRPDWGKWWRDQGKKMDVSPERPNVAADVRDYWESYWGEPYGAAAGPAKPAASGGAPFERVDKPTTAQVKEAVAEIDEAFRTGGPAERSLAIEKNAGIIDPDVVHQIARGLRDENRQVQLTAIEMLGWEKDKGALKQLHRMFNRERSLNKDDEVYSALLKAIGRSGDPSSVEVLTENIFKGGLSYAAGRARILGLANVRTNEAVEEMFQAMRLGGNGRDRRGGVDARPRFAEDMRLALCVATGEDLGTDKDAWLAWWQKNKKSFKISSKRPTIAPELKARWESYWGESY